MFDPWPMISPKCSDIAQVHIHRPQKQNVSGGSTRSSVAKQHAPGVRAKEMLDSYMAQDRELGSDMSASICLY